MMTKNKSFFQVAFRFYCLCYFVHNCDFIIKKNPDKTNLQCGNFCKINFLFQLKLFPYLLLSSTSRYQVVETTAIIKTTTTKKKDTLTRNCGPPHCELLQISFYWLKMFIGYKVKFIAAVITALCFLFAITVRQLFQLKIRIIVTWSSFRRREEWMQTFWKKLTWCLFSVNPSHRKCCYHGNVWSTLCVICYRMLLNVWYEHRSWSHLGDVIATNLPTPLCQ